MNVTVDSSMPPRWLTWCAWLTVAAVIPLLFLGALVTTLKVGMADQRSVVSPLEAIVEMFGDEQSLGWKIEHGHRLAGWFVGLCGIGLALGFWFAEKGSKWRWLGTLGLALISVQGLLGIFRVKLNSLCGTDLAWFHGCLAQVVFAVLVGIALMASPSWRLQTSTASPTLRTWSVVCVGLVLGQLVLGGLIRHQPSLLMARFHIFGAFLVLTGLLWLAKLAFSHSFRWVGFLLLGLMGFEIALGVETVVHWMARFFRPELAAMETTMQLVTRTAHYVVGSLVFAITTIAALKAHRRVFSFAKTAKLPSAEATGPALVGRSLQGGVA